VLPAARLLLAVWLLSPASLAELLI